MAEVKRIEEKNVRIKKTLADLGLDDVILEPVMDTEEFPETLLDVKDSEVPFERFITKDVQIKIDEEKKREEGKTCVNIIWRTSIGFIFLDFYKHKTFTSWCYSGNCLSQCCFGQVSTSYFHSMTS